MPRYLISHLGKPSVFEPSCTSFPDSLACFVRLQDPFRASMLGSLQSMVQCLSTLSSTHIILTFMTIRLGAQIRHPFNRKIAARQASRG